MENNEGVIEIKCEDNEVLDVISKHEKNGCVHLDTFDPDVPVTDEETDSF